MDKRKGLAKSESAETLQRKEHETSDAQIFPVVAFIVALVVLIVLSLVGMVFLFDWLEESSASRDRAPSALATPNQLPPEPRLDMTPRGDLDAVESMALERLTRYQWIDKEAGVIGIPIERAMELLVERGLPTRGAPQSASGTAGESR